MKNSIVSAVIFIVLIAVGIKLLTPSLLKKSIISKSQSLAKSTYEADLKVSIAKLDVKVIKLFLLKPTLTIRELRFGKKAIFEEVQAEINLYELFFKNNLVFDQLKINLSEVIVSEDFNIYGTNNSNKSKIKKFFFRKAEFENMDLIISNSELEKRKFELRKISLKLKDFSLPASTKNTEFEFSSNLKNYQKNGFLKLKGRVIQEKDSQELQYIATGELKDLNLQNFLTVVTSKKHALTGSLTAKDIKIETNTSGINLTANIDLKKGSNFLLDYIKDSLQEFKLPVNKILERSTSLGKDLSKNPYYVDLESTKSRSVEFSSLISITNTDVYLTKTKVKRHYQAPSFNSKQSSKKTQKKKKRSFFGRIKSIF